MPTNILYICYFGLNEPLVQTQVLPYLRELRKDGHEISLLTFEPRAGEGEKRRRGNEEITAELAADGIEWHWLRYHKRLSVLATAYDIFRGALFIRGMIRGKELDLLHGRVHVPTLMGAIARKLSGRKPKLLFDIRGFMPEEYTDAGVWPEGGLLYRTAKRVEGWLLKEADAFVVLTEKAREILFPESRDSGFDKLDRPVEVIPCCVDLRRFASVDESARNAVRERLGIGEDRNVIIYVGSFGGWYMTEEMLDLFEAARTADPATFVLVLTQRDKENVAEKLRNRGFSPDDFFVDSVTPGEIPAYLAASDTAVSFIKACYSKLSSSPTKIAEYLAAGLPIVVNAGVGDVDDLIERRQVGAIIDGFSSAGYLKALRQIKEMGDVRSRCRETAFDEFDLERSGGTKYRLLYNRILKNDAGKN
jgi:glycosyltransferase involved in cell wall biosynthesis